ncbi:MAG: outer membrane protein assembly factor BamC [Gammaproteobacteria bacterium]
MLPLLAVAALAGNGCSTIKSYFPDKEKDYQFKTEIPELVLPEDLGHHSIETPPATEPAIAPRAEAKAKAEQRPAAESIRVERVIYDGGASRLRIFQPLAKTWTIVGKALARKAVEIVSRNKPEGMYIVMYDPTEQKVTDDSLWDEMLFVFSQRGGKEQEYRIKLADYGDYTEAIVLDEHDKPLSNGPGMSLLQLIQEAIESDFAGTDDAAVQQ